MPHSQAPHPSDNGGTRKRVRFGDVTYIAIPPRRRRRMASHQTCAEVSPLEEAVNVLGDACHVPLVESPIGAASQRPCDQLLEDDLLFTPVLPSCSASLPLTPTAEFLGSPDTSSQRLPARTDDGIESVGALVCASPPTPMLSESPSSPLLAVLGDVTPDASTGSVTADSDAPSAARRTAVMSTLTPPSGEAQTTVARRLVVDDCEATLSPTHRAVSASPTHAQRSCATAEAAHTTLSSSTDLSTPRHTLSCAFCGLEMAAPPSAERCGVDNAGEPQMTAPLAAHWTSVDDITCHIACALWCSDVFYDNASGSLQHVQDALQRAQEIVCHYCHGKGASVACAETDCSCHYHLPCAIKAKARVDSDLFVLRCPSHSVNLTHDH